jgi:hypothetical protein
MARSAIDGVRLEVVHGTANDLQLRYALLKNGNVVGYTLVDSTFLSGLDPCLSDFYMLVFDEFSVFKTTLEKLFLGKSGVFEKELEPPELTEL